MTVGEAKDVLRSARSGISKVLDARAKGSLDLDIEGGRRLTDIEIKLANLIDEM